MFVYVYNVPFRFLPVSSGKLLAFMGILLFIVRKKKKVFLPLNMRTVLWGWIILICYSCFLVIGKRTYDFSLIYSELLFVIEHLLGAVTIVYLLIKVGKNNINSIMRMLVNVITLQAVIMLLSISFPYIKDFVFSIVKEDTRMLISDRYGGFRGVGLAASTTYDLAVLQSIGLMIIPLLYKAQMKGFFFFKFVVIILSVFISGRTGFIGIILSFVLVLLSCIGSNFTLISKTTLIRLLKGCILGCGILFIIALLCYRIMSADLKFMIDEYIIPYAFEMFISYEKTGAIETHSSNYLIDWYSNIPHTDVIFGDGRYVDPFDSQFYYLGIDAGFLRHYFYFGLIGTFFIMFIYSKIFSSVLYYNRNNKLQFCFFIFLIIYFILSHVKGDFLLGSNMNIKVLFLFYCFYNFSNYFNEKNSSNSTCIK